MVRSLGLHLGVRALPVPIGDRPRIEARSFAGFLARVNLILLAHNLIRSRLLLVDIKS
jgi:hypothetical protein